MDGLATPEQVPPFIIGGGSTKPHYLFLAAVELVCLALIVRHAWRWREPAPAPVSPR